MAGYKATNYQAHQIISWLQIWINLGELSHCAMRRTLVVLSFPLYSSNPTKSPEDGLLPILQMAKLRQKEGMAIAESMLDPRPACHGVPALADPEGAYLAILPNAVHGVLITVELHGADLPTVSPPAHCTLVLLHV